MHLIKREAIVRENLDTVWHFFSRPENLDKITPDDMSFEILSDIKDVPMHAGMIIRYKVRPLANIPMTWVTEITQCEEGRFFVDEQRFGPYRFWHHQHHFESLGDGRVRLTDIVHYKVGFGFIGRWMNALFIRKKLEGIFAHRTKVVGEIFQLESEPAVLNA